MTDDSSAQRTKRSKTKSTKRAKATEEADVAPVFEDIEPVKLHELTETRYLNYALSVITSRALPDVRDGLKPVQRRILYAMYHDLKLRRDSRFLKSARVVGDVMGKYHPHGDQSIYEALVRMSQPFSLRYPLVEGYGNFGSLDGDSAAAMRYTEARLAGMAEELLGELGRGTIDTRSNYDGQLEEPAVLPAQLPNLLVNGATGIAVGMATHIPPHNLKEVITALLKVLKKPQITSEELTKTVRGPDFPTGGEILNTDEELAKIYATGHGSVKVRGTYTIEKVEGHERKRQIVITSIPYELQKGSLVEKIAQLVVDKKVPQIVDVRDESAEDIRVVLELKRSESAEAAMAFLYKHTPLQQNFNINLTCLVPEGERGLKPQRLSLKEMLEYFLEFRVDVVRRRLQHELDQLRSAIHRLEAFEVIYNALDEALTLIRNSDGKADASRKLQARFTLDEVQANAILETRLYRLAKLEINQVREELDARRARASECEALLSDDEALKGIVESELKGLRSKYGDSRKTLVVGPQEEVDFSPEAYIVKESAWVIVSKLGRVKRQRGFSELSAIRIPEGDAVQWAIHTDTRQSVTFFTQLGSAYTTLVAEIPSTTGYGDPLQALFKFSDGERVVGVAVNDARLYPQVELPSEASGDVAPLDGILSGDESTALLPPFGVALTRFGRVHRFPLSSYADPSTKGGRRYMSLESRDEVIACYTARGDEVVALASVKGRATIFSIHDIPLRQRSSKGCVAIKLMQGDTVIGFVLSHNPLLGLTVRTGSGREKLIRESHNTASKLRRTRRGGRGTELIKRGQFEEWDWDPIVQSADTEEVEVEVEAEPTPSEDAPEATLSPSAHEPAPPASTSSSSNSEEP